MQIPPVIFLFCYSASHPLKITLLFESFKSEEIYKLVMEHLEKYKVFFLSSCLPGDIVAPLHCLQRRLPQLFPSPGSSDSWLGNQIALSAREGTLLSIEFTSGPLNGRPLRSLQRLISLLLKHTKDILVSEEQSICRARRTLIRSFCLVNTKSIFSENCQYACSKIS